MCQTDPDNARTPRLPSSGERERPRDVDDVLRRGTQGRDVRRRRRARAALPPGQPAVPRARRTRACDRASRTAVPHQRSGAGFAALIFPLEQHPRRRADRRRDPGPIEPAQSAQGAGAADARRSARRFTRRELCAAVALPPQPAGHVARRHLLPELGRRTATEPEARVRAVLREHRS